MWHDMGKGYMWRGDKCYVWHMWYVKGTYGDLLLNTGDAGEGDCCLAAPQLIERWLLASHLTIGFSFSDPDPDPHRLLQSDDLVLPLLNGFLLLLPPLVKKLLVPEHRNLFWVEWKWVIKNDIHLVSVPSFCFSLSLKLSMVAWVSQWLWWKYILFWNCIYHFCASMHRQKLSYHLKQTEWK